LKSIWISYEESSKRPNYYRDKVAQIDGWKSRAGLGNAGIKTNKRLLKLGQDLPPLRALLRAGRGGARSNAVARRRLAEHHGKVAEGGGVS